MMTIKSTYVLVCENAIQSPEKKVSLINIFDEINGESLPMIYGSMYLVGKVQIEGTPNTKKGLPITIDLIDPDGVQVETSDPNMQIDLSHKKTYTGFIVHVPQIVFEKTGNYKFIVNIDGKNIGETTIKANLVKK